jgi:uncharacterized membrane protein
MKTIWTPAIILALLVVSFEVYVNSSGSQLPEQVASHFGLTGEANDSMSREGWTFFLSLAGVALGGLFAVLAMLLPFFPDRFVNLPDRQYWLAPERRRQTLGRISGTMLWSACLMILFLAGIYYLTIRANRLSPPRLEAVPFVIVIGGFLLAEVALVIRLILHFAKRT